MDFGNGLSCSPCNRALPGGEGHLSFPGALRYLMSLPQKLATMASKVRYWRKLLVRGVGGWCGRSVVRCIGQCGPVLLPFLDVSGPFAVVSRPRSWPRRTLSLTFPELVCVSLPLLRCTVFPMVFSEGTQSCATSLGRVSCARYRGLSVVLCEGGFLCGVADDLHQMVSGFSLSLTLLIVTISGQGHGSTGSWDSQWFRLQPFSDRCGSKESDAMLARRRDCLFLRVENANSVVVSGGARRATSGTAPANDEDQRTRVRVAATRTGVQSSTDD